MARLLLEQPERLAARAGRPLVLRRVVVRDPDKPRPVRSRPSCSRPTCDAVLRDPQRPGRRRTGRRRRLGPTRPCCALLAAGKDVVTANKALLAQHGAEVFDAARRHGRAVAFEASVAGGVPIIAALAQCLAANQILVAPGHPQRHLQLHPHRHDRARPAATPRPWPRPSGAATPRPTRPSTWTAPTPPTSWPSSPRSPSAWPCRWRPSSGAASPASTRIDIRFAGELGYTIKLLAEAWLHDGPAGRCTSRRCCCAGTTPLAQVRGAYNAIHVVGDAVGDTLFYGQGAGQMPTASAVVADLIDLAVGRAQRHVPDAAALVARRAARCSCGPPASVRSRFYLRLLVDDRPGVLAEVARVLAQHQISIASVIQHEVPDEPRGQRVQLVIMTHTAATGHFRGACAARPAGVPVGPGGVLPGRGLQGAVRPIRSPSPLYSGERG